MEPAHTTTSKHPDISSQSSHKPITISLDYDYDLNLATFESEGIVQLSDEFKHHVKQTVDGLKNYDTIIINLKVHSIGNIPSNQPVPEEGIARHESEPTDERNHETSMDARHLERILSTIYTLVEREKAIREQLMMLQVDVLIDGFSQLARSHSSLLSQHPTQSFRTLALGGTFDHLHSGHKILLTIACWLTTHTLIVGITDDELLKKKKYANKLQGVNERKEGVKRFIERIGPKDIKLEMPTLRDVYGPTATESDIDGLLVTKETVSGAESIDQIRALHRLKPIKRYVIDVISDVPECTVIKDENQLFKDLKISSTQIRAWLNNYER